MRFEDLFCAVYKALEQNFLLTEVELVKDYSNLCFILKPTKLLEESLTGTLTQWRKDSERVGDPNKARPPFGAHEMRDAGSGQGIFKPQRQPVMRYEDALHFDKNNYAHPVSLKKDPKPYNDAQFPPQNLSALTTQACDALPEAPKSLLADFRSVMMPSLVGMNDGGMSFPKDFMPASNLNYQPITSLITSKPPAQQPEPPKEQPTNNGNDNGKEVVVATTAPAAENDDKTVKKITKKQRKAMVRGIKKKFACTFCPFECDQIELLVTHMPTHGARPYKCTTCSYKCRTSQMLIKHIRIHTSLKNKIEKKFSCKYCSYTTKYQQSIGSHVKSVHPESSSLYKCTLCSFTTLDDNRRDTHIRAHEQNISFPCEICGKVLYDKLDLKYHVNNHNRLVPRQKNISCPECGEKFYTNERLNCHMYKHTGQKDFKCRLCGLEYQKFLSMVRHFKKHHPNEQVFHCPLCNFHTSNLREKKKHFTSLSHLERETAATTAMLDV